MVKPTQETKQPEWVVVVGGFSSTKEMWEEEVLDLANCGKSVIFVTPDKGISPDENEAPYFENEGKTIPPTIQNKAAAVKRLLDYLNIKETNLVGQSQGGAIVATMVGMYPNLAKKVLLDSPAGIAKQGVAGFYGRAAVDSVTANLMKPKIKGEIHPELASKDAAQWSEYNKKLKQHLLWRLTKEIPDVARVDILPVLKGIRKRRKAMDGKFPQIILLNANKDPLFQAKKIEDRLTSENETGLPKDPLEYIDNWIMYVDKNMGHGKYRRPTPGMMPVVFSEDRRGAVIKQILVQ